MLKSKLKALIPAGVVTTVLAASFIVFPAVTSLASCGSGTFTANPPSPHVGGTVVLTATGNCGGYGGGTGYGYATNIPQFRFWIQAPGAGWIMVQDYSNANTYDWNTTGLALGDYHLEVDVKSADEPNSIGYDFVKNMTYRIGVGPCATANLVVTGGSTATTGPTGGTFTMTGSSTGCPNPVYRFWIQDPGRAWSMVQDYSVTTTHTWGPVGAWLIGQYRMEVDVRDSSETTVYDVVHNLTYNLVGCSGATLTPVPNGGVHGAVNVVLTATATCPGTAMYRFWVQDPGRSWSMVQDYSTTATYTWAKANQSAGTTNIEVDVIDQGSHEVYEFHTSGLTDTLT